MFVLSNDLQSAVVLNRNLLSHLAQDMDEPHSSIPVRMLASAEENQN